ncbi:hypothetical protein BgAZ_203660 [Babesia gibsoni]|uniref:SANT domain-containing protein n=1 Tax=Babesia gibsoni TaxID=33632 RepID=A0AAD8P9E5_BABGI|nr:hypothetical protein BgAZ_203660 [Babesia gibsoni]
MDRDRAYYSTRRPSRLRNSYPRSSPERIVESVRSNVAYRRAVGDDYGDMEGGYRDAVKSEYGTRYQRYISEDSYARQYNRTYSYPRRDLYNGGYAEYNTRSRRYLNVDNSYMDSRYPEPINGTPSSRNNTRSRSTHIVPDDINKIPRRAPSKWGDSMDIPDRKPSNSNGRMQLRYTGRQRFDVGLEDAYYYEHKRYEKETAQKERQIRVLQQSPRKIRAEADVIKPEENHIRVNVIPDKETETLISDKKPVLADAEVGEMAPTATVQDGVIDTLESEGILFVPETPVKKKRGRPKGAKTTKISTSSKKRAKKKEERDTTDTESSEQSVVNILAQPKRMSARIRMNNGGTPYSSAFTTDDEIYEEQLQKVIALSIKEATETPQTTSKTRVSSTSDSMESGSKTKESTGVSTEDDLYDGDYVPSTPKAQNKSKAKKTKEGASPTTTPKKKAKTQSKTKVTKRSKEVPSAVPETQEVKAQVEEQKKSVQTSEATIPVVNDGPGSAKMLFFEQYLDMSERMYCGKPLCVRQVDEEVNANSIQDIIKHEGETDTSVTVKKENDSVLVANSTNLDKKVLSNKPSASEKTAAESGQCQESVEDELFDFQCSTLELRFRVAFAMLTSDVRQSQMIDLWGPKELVLFELGMFKHGKEFHEIQRNIPTKTVQEIADMYYFWKKTNRYKLWKANRLY